MKIKMEIDENLQEEEIILRCRELNEDVVNLQKRLLEAVNMDMRITVMREEKEVFLSLSEILFFETANSCVAVHTAMQIYETHIRLYELEEILPGSFLRVSKSCIINTRQIRSVRKNITGSSEVEFCDSAKKAFVSRNYFKLLSDKLEEKRLKR